MKNGIPAIVLALSGGVLMHSPIALGQIKIDNLSAERDAASVAIAPASPSAIAEPAPKADSQVSSGGLFNQVQQLQQEVMQLRGIVEEQSHTITQLQQQRKDDYLSIDRRLSAMQSGAHSGAASEPSVTRNSRTEVAKSPPKAGEEKAYKAAYELIKQQKIPEATAAFESFLKSYPAGRYTPNGYYWLAELYQLKPDLERSRQLFEQLLAQYPNDRKAIDAMFKLGKTYYLLGDKAKAKQILEELPVKYKGGSASTLKMAADFLQQNY
ncbi:tol-pal system protein YbgF [Sinobacterium caligoides]|uniref:Cell division coordinator CpoB n=1 Tax=Sinobacterium caligoides TaxID=933926 RepID=A0A3N2DG20_9GAMM|nr:tetratricopeptide repeat protein [Sinobacterium caligoides]ROR98750.1 tol-pal system protein YbgF [Sinobacterium caligoides]